LVGQIPSPEAERLEEHLAQCAGCAAIVRTLRIKDTLVDAMKQAPVAALQGSEDGHIERLIYRASALGALPAAREEAAPPAVTSQDRYDFLASSQGPGEMGRLGSYRVLKVLGKGGMGIVFLAEDPSLKRLVALKVLKPALAADAEARRRFQREAEATAAIDHDHIVSIYQVGEDQGVPFLAMQLLKGESLDDRLKREGRLPLAEVLRIGREIAAGLAAAHRHGLIHRDIKPGNIWLEAGSGRVKILDFGLARVAEDNIFRTPTGDILGTPAYMAPEQAEGEAIDLRCDLFSLGCVLYQLCTGQVPFRRSGMMSTLLALAQQKAKPPRKINPEVPPALSDLVMTLMAKRPNDRPVSAQEVVAALGEMEEERKPPARRVQTASRGKGRRVMAWACCLLGVLLVIGIAPFGGTLLRLATNKGELIIETSDRDIEVTIRQGEGQPEVHLVDRRTKRALVLQAGDYEIQVKEKDGLQFATKRLTLNRGGQEVVKVELLLAAAKQPAGPARFRAGELPVERVMGDGRLHHWAYVDAVAVSPNGQLIASGGHDQAVRVWDTVTGQERWSQGPNGAVLSVYFHPGGKLLASGGTDHKAKVWDVTTGELLHVLEIGGTVHTVAFSPDGKVVAAMTKSLIRLWDADTAKELLEIPIKDGDIEDISGGFAFSPDGERLAFRAGGGRVKVCETVTGKERHVFESLGKRVSCLTYSPDGKYLAVGTLPPGPMVTIRDAETGEERHTFRHAYPEEGVVSLAYRADGKALAVAFCLQRFTAGTFCGRVRQWDLSAGKEGATLLQKVPNSGYNAVAFSPDGRTLVTASNDYTVRLWEAANGEERAEPGGTAAYLHALALSPDGKTAACGTYAHVIKLFDLATGREGRSLRGHSQAVTSLAFSPDGKFLASTAGDSTIRLWEVDTGRQRFSWQRVAGRPAFQPHGELLATSWWGSEIPVKLWNTRTGEESAKIQEPGAKYSACVAFNPDGTKLATGFGDRPVIQWDVATGMKKCQLLPSTGDKSLSAFALAYSPDGKTLAVAHGGSPCAVNLWDAETGRLRLVLPDCDWLMTCLAFSRDGKFLATGSEYDGKVRLWDASTGQPLRTFALTPWMGRIREVAFTPDGRRLVTLNGNGTVSVLRLDQASAP
jgi:WD40 repeat protein